jgi:hypothetical protein
MQAFPPKLNQRIPLKKAYLVVASLIVLALAGTVWASTFSAICLNNVQVGGQYSQVVSIRFLTQSDMPLTSARVYWIIPNSSEHAGYASGNGGHYTYTLNVDTNGQPGKVLATADGVENEYTENGRGDFPLIYFPQVWLAKGSYYDIVITNTDPNPSENYSSLDFLWNPDYTDQTPDTQIWISMWGEKFGWGYNGTLIGSPVALFFFNGTVQGHGDIATGSEYENGLECGSAYGFPTSICQY